MRAHGDGAAGWVTGVRLLRAPRLVKAEERRTSAGIYCGGGTVKSVTFKSISSKRTPDKSVPVKSVLSKSTMSALP